MKTQIYLYIRYLLTHSSHLPISILFTEDDPNSDAVNAAKALIKCGVNEGHLKSDYKVVAHRQLASTESPGRKLYQEIRKWPDWVEDVSSIKK